jgi:hypothetical protein
MMSNPREVVEKYDGNKHDKHNSMLVSRKKKQTLRGTVSSLKDQCVPSLDVRQQLDLFPGFLCFCLTTLFDNPLDYIIL